MSIQAKTSIHKAASKPRLYDIKEVTLTPRVPLHADLYPRFPAVYVRFYIEGVSSAIANAIRRTMGGELLVKGLDCELTDITTNADFIIHEMISKRLRMLPLQQSVAIGDTFEMNVNNPSINEIDVKTSELKGKTIAFNQNVTLFRLSANTYCKIKATVVQKYGYDVGYGTFVVAVNVVSKPADPAEYNTPSSISDCRRWKISFLTNGTQKPQIIIKETITELIGRLQSIETTFISSNNVHALTIENESNTLGKMLTKQIIELNPDITYITINEEPDRSLKLRMVADDPQKVLKGAIEALIHTFRLLLL